MLNYITILLASVFLFIPVKVFFGYLTFNTKENYFQAKKENTRSI